jgi:hypothetical protein
MIPILVLTRGFLIKRSSRAGLRRIESGASAAVDR